MWFNEINSITKNFQTFQKFYFIRKLLLGALLMTDWTLKCWFQDLEKSMTEEVLSIKLIL